MTPEELRDDFTRSGLNLIGQALSIFDADLRLAVSNHQYKAMFDLPDELTLPGSLFEDTIDFLVRRGEYGPQDDPEAAVRYRVEQARTFQPHYFERERPDGRWIAVEGAPLAQGGWIAVYTDITETKRQEALLRARSEELSEQVLEHAERLASANRELAASNAALQEAQRVLTRTEARTRQVTEMVPAHIAHLDTNYRYTFSNRQLPLVFPGSPANVIGLTVEQTLGAATFTTLRHWLERAMAGEPQVLEITHKPSGRRIRIALTPDRVGQGVYVLSTDVSAEVQAREALSHASKRNLAAQLTSGMAHDFGNLLTIILGLQGRLTSANLPPDAVEDVHATLAAARRGAALLGKLSQISGQREMSLQPVNLPALLHDVVTLARPSLDDGIELQLTVHLPHHDILLDPDSLQDSLFNLILNANAAMLESGAIELTAQISGAWLEITVEDTGPGFSDDALLRATEPFFSTKAGQGSGLGLSMVYDQTKLLGGTMRLSNTDKGACVTLRLPKREALRQMILLVEDDNLIRADIRNQLIGLGHIVIEAASLSEAMAMTDLPGLTLILSDIQLGDGLGSELNMTGLPLILMTSLPASDPLRRQAGIVLTKPFTLSQLATALTDATKEIR